MRICHQSLFEPTTKPPILGRFLIKSYLWAKMDVCSICFVTLGGGSGHLRPLNKQYAVDVCCVHNRRRHNIQDSKCIVFQDDRFDQNMSENRTFCCACMNALEIMCGKVKCKCSPTSPLDSPLPIILLWPNILIFLYFMALGSYGDLKNIGKRVT